MSNSARVSNAASKRSRGFCFTWNHYPESWRSTLDSIPVSYWIVGKETAPSTGTPHLQGYLYFSNARTWSSVRKQLPGTHLLCARGTPSANMDYCKKEGDYFESGLPPQSDAERGDGERARWDTAFTSIRDGKLEDVPRDILIRYIVY